MGIASAPRATAGMPKLRFHLQNNWSAVFKSSMTIKSTGRKGELFYIEGD